MCGHTCAVLAAIESWALFFHLLGAFLFVGGVIVAGVAFEAALALFVVVGALGAVDGQRPKRARKLAEQLAREGDAETPELRALLDDRLALAVNYLSAVLVLAIVVLMVFKPGAG